MSHFRSVVLLGAVLASLAGVPTPASAIPMQAVYTGTVGSGSDLTGLFGLGANSDLSGLGFTMSFIYDPATVGAHRFTDASEDSVLGGSLSGFTNPFLSAIIAINGQSQSVAGDYESSALNTNNADIGSPFSITQQHVIAESDDGLTQVFRQLLGSVSLASLAIPVDLETAFSLDLIGNASGSFHLSSYDYVNGLTNYNTSGSLNATHLTVSRYGDVPEIPLPAALPLLLSAIAGLGILARRRKRVNIAT